jgi:hypothetical protein
MTEIPTPDRLPAVLQELRKQTKMLTHIRSHVTIVAWCVFLYLVAQIFGALLSNFSAR